MEFAFDGEALYIVQCRPQSQRREIAPVVIPNDVPPERQLFSTDRLVSSSDVRDIEFIVYVEPNDYDSIPTSEMKTEVARVVGRLNHALQESVFILMGPGRWGSNDINLGVRVTYADINHARALVEIARQKDGYTPEVSYGTHFFQDLTEDSIAYVPLYPDDPDVIFNEEFFSQARNCLIETLPECSEFERWVRVIDVPRNTGGGRLRLMTDANADRGLAFIEGGSM